MIVLYDDHCTACCVWLAMQMLRSLEQSQTSVIEQYTHVLNFTNQNLFVRPNYSAIDFVNEIGSWPLFSYTHPLSTTKLVKLPCSNGNCR